MAAGMKFDVVQSSLTESGCNEGSNESRTNSISGKRGLIICEFCQVPFLLKTRYERHRKLHTDELPFCCIYCGDKFSHVMDLQNHRDKEHMSNKSFKCQDCPKTFSSRTGLKEHKWRHTGEKLYQCGVCEKRFSSKGNLKLHAMKHEGTKNYRCHICSLGFSSYSSMERHVARHSGFRPYQCRFCKERFSQVFQLKIHERAHTGDQPYKCDGCNKVFYSNPVLQRHKKVHP